MRQTETRKMADLATEIEVLLSVNQNIILPVTGSSMYPFLIEGMDSVELAFIEVNNIVRGDIVLIKNDNEQYLLHRIVRKIDDVFYLNGDSQTTIEGPFCSFHLKGKVVAIHRDGKRIDLGKASIKIIVFLWMLLLPFRKILLRVLRRLNRTTVSD